MASASSDPIVVVGGGISGLRVASLLCARGAPCVLLDARSEVGGRAASLVSVRAIGRMSRTSRPRSTSRRRMNTWTRKRRSGRAALEWQTPVRGTELAGEQPGYLEGALDAAERAATLALELAPRVT